MKRLKECAAGLEAMKMFFEKCHVSATCDWELTGKEAVKKN